MPAVNIPISDLEQSVERPVILDVLRQMQEYTGISSRTQIKFFGDENKAPQFNSTLTKDETTHNQWPHNERVTIEVESDFAEDSLLTVNSDWSNEPFCFNDPELGVAMRPIKSPTDVIIRVKYQTKDKNQADRWRNNLRDRLGRNASGLMHSVKYNYGFPSELIDIFYQVYTRKENVAGYGDTFDQWIKNNSSPRLTALSNQSATRFSLVFGEEQVGIQGFFDFNIPDKPAKEDEHDNRILGFTYKFRYDKPTTMKLYYPHMVHQQLMPDMYLQKNNPYDLVQMYKSGSFSWQDWDNFTDTTILLKSFGSDGISIPNFDTFIPSFIPASTLKMFTALTSITVEDKRLLLNLKDLGDYCIRPEILAFMLGSEYPFMGKTYHSVFCLSLYENGMIQETNTLVVDSALNVSSVNDLDLRKTYHVRLSLVADFSKLSDAARQRLRNSAALRIIIDAINNGLRNAGGQPDLMKTRLSDNDLAFVGLSNHGLSVLFPTTVQSFFLIAKKLEKLT